MYVRHFVNWGKRVGRENSMIIRALKKTTTQECDQTITYAGSSREISALASACSVSVSMLLAKSEGSSSFRLGTEGRRGWNYCSYISSEGPQPLLSYSLSPNYREKL